MMRIHWITLLLLALPLCILGCEEEAQDVSAETSKPVDAAKPDDPDPAPETTTEAEEPTETEPQAATTASADFDPKAVIATVGEQTITAGDIRTVLDYTIASANENLANLPAPQLRELEKSILQQLILQRLLHAYLEDEEVDYQQEDLTTIREELAAEAARAGMKMEDWMKAAGMSEQMLKDLARARNLSRELTTEAKLDAMIKEYPHLFDDTQVQASHVLIACPPVAPTWKQQAAFKKLKEVREKIVAGDLSFEEAANDYSDCPSGKQSGGDLGPFLFDQMVPTFSIAAFGAKTGEVTDIVRTQYGFHIIKVTDRTDGSGEPGPRAKDRARSIISSQWENRIFDQAMGEVPITIAAEPAPSEGAGE